MKCALCRAELIDDASICRVCGLINPGSIPREPGLPPVPEEGEK